LEIGTEELPAADLDSALGQLRERVPSLLKELSLEHGAIRAYGTPRRLAVTIEDLNPRQPDRESLVKGPPAEKAFDAAGMPTPAALGFARKNGLKASELEVRDQDGGKYVFAIVSQEGQPAVDVLAAALPGLIASIKFEKSMKWNASGAVFSRPIRWLITLLGDQPIPFEYAGISSSNTTRGLRPYDSPEIKIPSADSYTGILEKAGIQLDSEARRTSILEQVNQAASLLGGQALIDDALLAEVTNLVEMPTAVMGAFNPEFLSLPRDVLISVMKKHQRYFPLEKNGKLLPNFIAVRNGDDLGIDLVREGNEHVLGARFADANFFVREDVKQPLEAYRPRLSTLIFQAKLGSMLDKSDRMGRLVGELIPMLKLDAAEAVFARRAVHLAKADLVTQMVTEMTSLQGIIGREYALRSGEQAQVAAAIGEQYQPVPKSRIGVAIALSDRLDSLVGLFGAGLAPTGAKDPFGLRRAAIGVVQPLIDHCLPFDLRLAVKKAAALQPIEVKPGIQDQVLDFLAGRLSVVLKESGHRYDVVDAVLAEQAADPCGATAAVRQLQSWVERPDWSTILPAFARCVRITRDQKQVFPVSAKTLVEKEEKALFQAVEQAEKQARLPGSVDDFLQAFQPLIPVVNAFFEKVLVMADDPALRGNRLGLLQRIAALSRGVADLAKLEGF
jgi:glycyl-tRNA synthetase